MSLLKQSFVLATARTLTLIVQFINPIFLVRILRPADYGLYQEFIVYSMLAVSFVEFSVKSNLLYFVPRDPGRARDYITSTTALNLLFTVLGSAAILIFRGHLIKLTTWDVTVPLLIYLATYVNLDYLEIYWIATRRSTNVLYYGLTLAVCRTSAVVLTAYFTHSVIAVIYAVILFQVAKCLFVAAYVLYNRLLKWKLDLHVVKAQMRFVVPLGAAAVILYFNNEISKVIISSQLGAVALAMYANGSRQIPLTSIVRASVSDVVFPEIVRLNATEPARGLDLWKRANVAQSFLIVPVFFTAFYYGDVIINTLFTREYARAIPIFRTYLLLMLFTDGLEMGAPLRAMHRNRSFIYGNVLSLGVNVALLYSLFKIYPFYGPALALVLTTFSLQVFMGTQILRAYRTSISRLFLWRKHAMILGAGLVCVPVMVIGEKIMDGTVLGAVVFGSLYCVLYLIVTRLMRIEEVDSLVARTLGRVARTAAALRARG